MHIINLRKHYPHYTEDIFLEVSDEVYEAILHSIRQENNYKGRMYYHKAQYSLDCGELLHLMVKSSVAQNKTNRDTIQLDFLQRACKVA